MVRRRLGILGLAGSLALLPLPAEAGAPTEQLKTAAEKVVQILEDPALQPEARALERQAAVRAVIIDLFDFEEISRRALAQHWRTLSDPEREEFVKLFRTLLDRTYLPRIKLYQGERVQFVGESQDGDFASVHTRLANRQFRDVAVMFRMRWAGDRWLIFDVSVEGISLVANYRAQFGQIIHRASYGGLVTRIKQKLATVEDADGTRSTAETK